MYKSDKLLNSTVEPFRSYEKSIQMNGSWTLRTLRPIRKQASHWKPFLEANGFVPLTGLYPWWYSQSEAKSYGPYDKWLRINFIEFKIKLLSIDLLTVSSSCSNLTTKIRTKGKSIIYFPHNNIPKFVRWIAFNPCWSLWDSSKISFKNASALIAQDK